METSTIWKCQGVMFYIVEHNIRYSLIPLKYCESKGKNDSFSEPHICGYTLILMQELNLITRYPALYWNTACLSVNAGNFSDEMSKTTDYGAIAKAISNMDKGFVLPPYINKAQLQFIPLAKEGKAMYSLGAINGIGEDVAKAIISNRPYYNFNNFLEKCVATKLIAPSKVYSLIKAGCFDKLEKDRKKLMMEYVEYTTEEKTKLTVANIPKVLEFGLLPDEYHIFSTLYQFKKLVFTKSNLIESINKSVGLYKIPANLLAYYNENYANIFVDAFDIGFNGEECLNNKLFDKIYKEYTLPLTEWLSTTDAVNRFNNYLKGITWNKYCAGTIEQWEMESICFYTDKHEMDLLPLDRYPVVNFFDLPEEPEVVKTKKWRKGTISEFKLDIIAGVVVEKNKNKSIITISTKEGVVDIKLDKGRFAHYDRSVDADKSWFTKGTRLIVVGYRRGGVFYPKTYRESIYKHSIMQINGYNNTDIFFKLDRDFSREEI